MAIFGGREVKIGIAKESTRGTYVAPQYWVARAAGNFDDKFDIIEDPSSRGTIDAAIGAAKSKQWAEGTVEGMVRGNEFGLILKALYGTETVATASGESIVYEHTFDLQTSAQHPSLSITKKDPARTYGYVNAMISSLEITADPDNFVSFVAGFRAKVGATQSQTATYVDQKVFTRSMVTLKRATSLAGLAGGTAINVRNFKVTFTPNLVDDDILGSADPNDFLNTTFRIEGEFELKYEDETFHDFTKNQTATYYRLYMEDPTTIGTAEKTSIEFLFADVISKEWERTDENDEIVGQTIKFVGRYDLTDAISSRIILTNLISAAY